MPPNGRQALESAMLDLLKQEVPPQGARPKDTTGCVATPDRCWRRWAAPAQTTASSRPIKPSLPIRCAAPTLRVEMAECLGQLKYPAGAKVDYQSLANLVGHETVEICRRELDAARSAARPASRRLLVYALYSALRGLEGSDSRSGLLAAAAGTDGQKFIDTLRGKVKAAYQTAEDEDVADTDLANKVGDAVTEIQGVLGPKPALKPETVAAEDKAPAAAPAGQPDAARAAAPVRTAGGN